MSFLEDVALVEFGARVTRKKDAGTLYPVYGGGGATFSIDQYNRRDCYIVSRFAMSEECVRYVSGKFFLNDSGLSVTTQDPSKLLQSYLDKFLLGKQAEIYSLGRGAAQRNLNVSAFKRLVVPIPSVDEQQRIVAILDQAFAALDRARAHTDANLTDARELLKVKLDAVFKESEHGKCCISDVFQVGSSKRVLKSDWKSSGVPFYRGREVTRLALEGHVENELFISEEHYEDLAAKTGVPAPNDIVITAIGTIGNAYIVRQSDRFYFKDASVLWMRRTANVSSEYVKLWIRSSSFHDQLERGNGATVDTLTIGRLKDLVIPLPSLEEQGRIVRELKASEEKAVHLQTLYERQMADVTALRQSLLQQAFSGQLT